MDFFGIQTIKSGRQPRQSEDLITGKYSLADWTKNVKELSAATRDKCATFLKITPKMSIHEFS